MDYDNGRMPPDSHEYHHTLVSQITQLNLKLKTSFQLLNY